MGIIPWLIMMRMRAAEHAKARASGSPEDKKSMRMRLEMAEFMRKQSERDSRRTQPYDPLQQSQSILDGGF